MSKTLVLWRLRVWSVLLCAETQVQMVELLVTALVVIVGRRVGSNVGAFGR